MSTDAKQQDVDRRDIREYDDIVQNLSELSLLRATETQLASLSSIMIARTFNRWQQLLWVGIIVCIVGMWVSVSARQGIILGRLKEIDATLDQRTERFERLEKNQAIIMNRMSK
jgi:hypothetical protein